MPNLVNRLHNAATSTDRGVTFVCEDPPVRVSWAELHEEAIRTAMALAAHGVGVGDHVALLGPTSRKLVTTIRAVWLAGATAVVLPLPMRMSSVEAFVAQTRKRILDADIALMMIDEQLAPFMDDQPGDPARISFDTLLADGIAGWVAPPEDPERLAILQYTSGSTSDPKGVMLPERTLLANLDALTTAGRLDQEGPDVFVSWLPLYHDMGLVGILSTAMAFGNELVLAAPQDFMASPSRWVQWLSDHGGTLTAAPNFAYVLAARAMERLDGLDLSRVRLAINGAEPVDTAAVQRFVTAGARHGLRPGCVFPAFGMAEVGIAGTFGEPLTGLVVDTIDQRVLETERYAARVDDDADDARSFARLGRPVPGLNMRIVDTETGAEMREREVGELQLRGTSVTSGYYRRDDVNAERFVDGWLRTGDLAYVVDGELVVCGRIKDLIIVAGRNVFPEDIELAVARVDDVRAGNVIAFSCDTGRRPGLVVVAETRSDDADELRLQVSRAVKDAVGLAAREIVLVPAGTLPKTSSGKLQRSLCRTRYLADEYPSARTAG
ncbi:MAG TPA: fatty acyl-AMP ligase [Acidimicrobiales bacterium]|nr:fatty acyl-AMP ligase [Acidimicrobiales bacterium]